MSRGRARALWVTFAVAALIGSVGSAQPRRRALPSLPAAAPGGSSAASAASSAPSPAASASASAAPATSTQGAAPPAVAAASQAEPSSPPTVPSQPPPGWYRATAMPVMPPPPPAEPPPPAPQWNVGLEASFRWSIVRSAGLDPFSENDILTHRGLALSARVLRLGKLSLGAAAGWELGEPDAKTRGSEASLTLHRLWLGADGSYPVTTWFHPFVRLAPDVFHVRASIDDPAASAPLVRRAWLFGGELTAGARLFAFAIGNQQAPSARIWIALEGGYAMTSSTKMKLHPDLEEDDPRQFGDLALPELSLSGPLWRLSLGFTL
jgi:hypothetical protein